MNKSVTEQIVDLKNISDKINIYLEDKVYEEELGPDLEEKQLLQILYDKLLDELAELGIHLQRDRVDLLQDLYLCQHIFCLRVFVDTRYIFDLCRRDKFYKQRLEMLLEDSTEDVLSEVLDLTEASHPDVTLHPYVRDILDHFYTDERYKQHVLATIDQLIAIEDDQLIEDPNVVPSVLKIILESRNKYAETIRYLFEQPNDFAWDTRSTRATLQNRIEKSISKYDGDKLNNVQAWHILLDPESTELQKGFYKEISDEHHRNNDHHIEYYISRNINPSMIQQMFIVSHPNEVGTTKEEYLQEITEIKEKMIQNNIEANMEYIDFLTQLVVDKEWS